MCDFDTPVTLIAVKVTGRDDIGNPIRVEKSSEAWAELKSVTRAEFQAAGAMGLKSSFLVVVPPASLRDSPHRELPPGRRVSGPWRRRPETPP